MTELQSSLYRCPGSCGHVVRFDAGRSLGCLCDALPLGSDGEKFDPPFGIEGGQIGPPRPYYHDREHAMIEFEDDGRSGVEDLRDHIWLA